MPEEEFDVNQLKEQFQSQYRYKQYQDTMKEELKRVPLIQKITAVALFYGHQEKLKKS